jgi:hypothetical protein
MCLEGCAATYVAPDGEDTANLILPAMVSSWDVVKALGASSYVRFGYADESGCGKYMNVPPEREGDKEVVVKIPSDRDIFIGHFATNGDYSCENHGSFKPKTGATYKVIKKGNGFECFLGVVEVNYYSKDVPIELSSAKYKSFSNVTVCKL